MIGAALIFICVLIIALGGMVTVKDESKDSVVVENEDQTKNVVLSIVFAVLAAFAFTINVV